MNTINIKDFDFEKLSLVSNKKNFYLKYDDNSFQLKIKNLYSPFHITDFKGDNKYKITSNTTKKLEDFMNKLKEKIVDLLIKNKDTKKIIKLKPTKEILMNNFNNIYKITEDDKWKNTFTLKLMNNIEDNENINLLVWDEKKQFISDKKIIKNEKLIDYFGRKTRFSVIVNPYFYNINKSIGISFQTKHLRIIEKEKNYQIHECSISDSEDDEKSLEKSTEKLEELEINL